MHETFFVLERMHDIFPIQLQADKSIKDMHDQQNQRNMIVLEHYFGNLISLFIIWQEFHDMNMS